MPDSNVPYTLLVPRDQRPPKRGSRAFVLLFAASAVGFVYFLAHLGHTRRTTTLYPSSSTSAACSPYDQRGYLAFDAHDAHANRWTPYAAGEDSCHRPAPALGAAFVRAAWDAQVPSKRPNGAEFAQAANGPDGREWEDVSWAKGRTVLLLGDSIHRFTTKYFCEMAGEAFLELSATHPWSPAPVPKDYKTTKYTAGGRPNAATNTSWHTLDAGNEGAHGGHYCYVPGLDFLLVHVHTYGLDREDYWVHKEDRINLLAVPYLANIRATAGRGDDAPELVHVNSGMWDVVRYSHEDASAGADLETPLSAARTREYRERVRDILVATAAAFPRAALRWVTTHYPIADSGAGGNAWFFGDAKQKPKTKPDVKLLRLVELHEAALSAIEDTGDASAPEAGVLERVGVNRWGTAMRGWEKHQVDSLHPAFLPGGYLWADMMLYDLRAALGH
ncbi:uncharacterized protein LOC62_01G000338 [Vanrija pseudolonga]|uniref:Uncharacterized protein n=1 Tax=Vanrija pseudolonga TaxID=143232 RepID=A0AAF0XZ60_9TREE|nr:hypothetical protein LOC62_01G000338 [Vanrija pseudolonga]